jgi:hypothetical protein
MYFLPFLPKVFVPGTSRAVQTHFVPSWYKEKWKKWKGETPGEFNLLENTSSLIVYYGSMKRGLKTRPIYMSVGAMKD